MKATVILSSGPGGELSRFENPIDCICATTYSQVPGALRVLQESLDHGKFIAGWISYEAGVSLFPSAVRPAQVPAAPLLWFGIFAAPTQIRRDDLEASGRGYAGSLHHEWNRKAYCQSFERIQEHIRAGDIYQANLSFRSHFHFFGDPFDLYLRLYDAAQIPFGGYVDTGEIQVLSLSPELFFKIDRGVIETQPMKGTAARGESREADRDARAALLSSEKDCAEHVMIVDLMRSDLGRLANPGTVNVAELMGVRTYPTFHTMVSTINAQLRPRLSLEELLSGLMPAGSITGAPKLRASQILNSIETSPREIYCGAVGFMDPFGDCTFNVAIRSIWIDRQIGKMGMGGAVVADSKSDEEYDECLLKASWFAGARRSIGLIETLLWGPGFNSLDRHLDRMAGSAKALSLTFERSAAHRTLRFAVSNTQGPQRVRLELDESGGFHCRTQPLGPAPPKWHFVVSPKTVCSGDALLPHKTTWRDLYESEWERCCAHGQADEVLFLNERAEVTEGSRTNLFIRIGTQLLTPPVSCGLLPGILRAELIEQGKCSERCLGLADLYAADEIFLGNALRGLIRATPAPSENGIADKKPEQNDSPSPGRLLPHRRV